MIEHLGRSMQLDRQIHPPQRHVLHDQCVDARSDQLAGLRLGVSQLGVGQKRIERRMYAHAVTVGILDDAGDFAGRISGGLTGPESGAADVDSIGTIIDRSDGRNVIFGGGEQFDRFHWAQNISDKIT